MTFAATITKLPFTGKSPDGSGFLPPIFRGSMHILYLLGMLADDKVTVEDKEAIGELKNALEHWNARETSKALSTATAERAGTVGEAIGFAVKEYALWKPDTRVANLRDLSNRIAQFAADLDRELVGFPHSDPGTSL